MLIEFDRGLLLPFFRTLLRLGLSWAPMFFFHQDFLGRKTCQAEPFLAFRLD